MSDDITRIALDTALDADATDWARLRAIDDAQIDAAMMADTDTFAIDDASASSTGVARYRVWKDDADRWAWVLVDERGERLAVSAKSYGSSNAAKAAIEELRSLLSTKHVKAA